VNQTAVVERARLDALISSEKTAIELRLQLAADAKRSIGLIFGTLKDQLVNLVTQGRLTQSTPDSWQFSLNQVRLGCSSDSRVFPRSILNSPGYPAPFDVITFSTIFLEIPADLYKYEGRSHTLWFCDARDKDVFRWFETAFMFGVFSGKRGRKAPFALEPCDKAGRALAPIMGTEFEIAWPFTPIDQGEQQSFIQRWIGWFADAAEGKLEYPRSMPERNPSGSWRKNDL